LSDLIEYYISEALFKLEEVYNWNKFVKPILIAYNISQQNSIKMTLYFLIYGKIARLLIEREIFNKNTLLNKVITLIYKLLLFRENARIVIKKVQKKIRQDYSM